VRAYTVLLVQFTYLRAHTVELAPLPLRWIKNAGIQNTRTPFYIYIYTADYEWSPTRVRERRASTRRSPLTTSDLTRPLPAPRAGAPSPQPLFTRYCSIRGFRVRIDNPLSPPPTCIARTIAILFTQYTTPLRPFSGMPYTIQYW